MISPVRREHATKGLTESHKLRRNCYSKYDQIENLDHTQVIIGAFRNENSADVEQYSFGKVDHSTGYAVSASLYKGAPHPGRESVISSFIELFLENAFKTHRADTPNV